MRRGLIAALIVFVLDQLSKWAVVEHVFKPKLGLPSLSMPEWYQSTERLPFVQVELLPFFNFSMMWNEGIGLGMLGGAGPVALVGLALAIVIALLVWMSREHNPLLHIALGMMIGGAIGNVIDRLRFEAVVDFLDVHAFGWHYPTFNIADSGVVLGVALLLLEPLFKGKVKPA